MVVATVASLALLGGSAAYADDGVGPSPGTSGQQRACEAHAVNSGQSNANGLQCDQSQFDCQSYGGTFQVGTAEQILWSCNNWVATNVWTQSSTLQSDCYADGGVYYVDWSFDGLHFSAVCST